MRNLPESEVTMPVCRPRMYTDTWLIGLSFSSTTLPETNADFFCEKVFRTNKTEQSSNKAGANLTTLV